ncbi:MAG: hypothetical protein ACJA0Y_000501 [Maricaulis maris]|jgi:hypothetical protein|tara:strand:- start:522 stop:731 length:210 start_codon:yes stop_codon:yes gene_type:complete
MEIHPVILAALYGLAGFGWWAACSENEREWVAPLVYAVFWPLTAFVALAWCLLMAGARTFERLTARGGR